MIVLLMWILDVHTRLSWFFRKQQPMKKKRPPTPNVGATIDRDIDWSIDPAASGPRLRRQEGPFMVVVYMNSRSIGYAPTTRWPMSSTSWS